MPGPIFGPSLALLIYLLRNLYVGQEATELDMEQLIGSKLGREYDKAVYCPPAYLIYMPNTSCKRLDWMNPKLESRLPEKISVGMGPELQSVNKAQASRKESG